MNIVTMPNPIRRPAAVDAIQWIEVEYPVQPNLELPISVSVELSQG